MRGIYGRFDSKIRFKIESDGRFDSNAKNDSQVPRQHLYTLLGCGIKFIWMLGTCCPQWCELTCTLQLNNTDGVRDISYVAANMLM